MREFLKDPKEIKKTTTIIDGKNEEMIKLYVRTAQGYTWDDRIEKASELIIETLDSYGHKRI